MASFTMQLTYRYILGDITCTVALEGTYVGGAQRLNRINLKLYGKNPSLPSPVFIRNQLQGKKSLIEQSQILLMIAILENITNIILYRSSVVFASPVCRSTEM